MNTARAKKHVHSVLSGYRSGNRLGRIFGLSMVALILLNILALILETVQPVYHAAPTLFSGFEIFSVAVFSAEYVLRVWSCTVQPEYAHPFKGRLKFAATPLAVFDLLAVVPFFLPFLGVDLRFIRTFRIFRLLYMTRLARYSKALHTLGRAFSRKKEELVITCMVVVILVLAASCLMYYVESPAQPKAFSSIPATMWWAVATLTTVGYGDIFPITALGKVLGSIVAFLGIGLFALPTGIIGSAFIEEIADRDKKGRNCPHCGSSVD